jgi:chemotaxis protein methyltransferase CheR
MAGVLMRPATANNPAPSREFEFSLRDFRFLADLVNQRTGIVLGDAKRDLVYGRLAKRLRQLKLASFREYCELLKGEHGGEELVTLTNALTTNHTGFFREPHHFEALQEWLTQLPAAQKRVRLWSAACSNGAEPYSMAMCVADALGEKSSRDVKILATDIDTQVLKTAAQGVYPNSMATPIPAAKRTRYTRTLDAEQFAVDDALKSLISFRPLNLLEGWPMKGPFDLIFCRNVVIYFDKPTQAKLFNRFADMLTPDGLLFIGHSETLFKVCDRFTLIGKTMYRRTQ